MKKLLLSSLLVASLASSVFGAFPGSGGIVIRPATSSSSSSYIPSTSLSVSAPQVYNSGYPSWAGRCTVIQYALYGCR